MHELILFIVGIIVGAMNAIAGGGMLIGFPVLVATGMPALIANATTCIIVLPGQITSAYGYRKYLTQIPKRYALLAIPCSLGAAIGTVILRHTSIESFEKLIPFLVVLAVVLFTFQPFLHRHAHHHIHGPKKHRNRWQPLVLLGLAFFPLAIYGGFFGTGIGFIMLAFLGFTRIHEFHRMTALKNMILISIVGTNFFCLLGSHLIDWRHGLFMAGGNAIGGLAGARGAQRVSSRSLRYAVIFIGMSAAIYLGFRSYLP
jgi:uncharacterized membrane protein YfcA